MALTENDKMMYRADILDFISRIPLKSVDDLPLLIAALRAIITPNSNTTISEHLQIGIMQICEYMHPEELRCRDYDRPVFVAYCTSVIEQQIERLETLTPEAQQAYIEKQSEIRLYPEEPPASANIVETLQTHWQMLQALPPVPTDSATISNRITGRGTGFETYPVGGMPFSTSERILRYLAWRDMRDMLRSAHSPIQPNLYGHWRRTHDTWGTTAFNGERHFHCDSGPFFKHLSIRRREDTSYYVCLETQTSDNSRLSAVREALILAGLRPTVPGIQMFPMPGNPSDSDFTFTGSRRDVLNTLERLFLVVNLLQPNQDIPQAMRAELTRSLGAHRSSSTRASNQAAAQLAGRAGRNGYRGTPSLINRISGITDGIYLEEDPQITLRWALEAMAASFAIGMLYCFRALARSSREALEGSSSRLALPVRYGNCVRFRDDWNLLATQPHSELNPPREKSFHYEQGKFLRKLIISSGSNGRFAVVLKVKPDVERIAHNNCHITVAYALTHAGFLQNTPGVQAFPKPTNSANSLFTPSIENSNFCLEGTAEEVLHALEQLFPVITNLEGSENIPEAMQTELTDALRAHIPHSAAQETAHSIRNQPTT